LQCASTTSWETCAARDSTSRARPRSCSDGVRSGSSRSRRNTLEGWDVASPGCGE
jgi:hypothetical protein